LPGTGVGDDIDLTTGPAFRCFTAGEALGRAIGLTTAPPLPFTPITGVGVAMADTRGILRLISPAAALFSNIFLTTFVGTADGWAGLVAIPGALAMATLVINPASMAEIINTIITRTSLIYSSPVRR
jgi:hypothetical protein